ncbi:hypothetical protein AB1N83_003362 [Pleurotus pulmonarius]
MPSRTKTPPGYILQAKFPPLLYTYWPDDTSTAFSKDANWSSAHTSSFSFQVAWKHTGSNSGSRPYSLCKSLHTLKSVDESPPRAASHTETARSKEPKESKKSKKSKKEPKESKQEPRVSHFSAFFAKYPEFQYHPANSAFLEFIRLCNRWERKDPRRVKARRAFKHALVREFNDIYGTDENDIGSWHKICIVLDIDPLPDTIQEARDAVSSKHINLVDLTQNPGGRVRIFCSLEQLRAYTNDTEKYFPKQNAYAGGLLKYLLREIRCKYRGDRGLSGSRGRRRRR